MRPFGTLTHREFLARYWQKKPLLVRNAFPSFPELVAPDELAGLSCEPEVISRLVLERGGTRPWELRRGPFNARTFRSLPKTRWTLLVNGVDRLLPQVNRLLDEFRFVPNWRIDDVMISYAVDGGNVGAHVDNFDVFLIQAQGTREWQIETKPRIEDDFVEGLDVRLLAKFKPNKKWKLGPGDMLYLPPRFPHHGIARGDGCMTYSVGFRAPSHVELVDGFVTSALSCMDGAERYRDADLRLHHPGQISGRELRTVREIIRTALRPDEHFDHWFGRYVTQPRDGDGASARAKPLTPQTLKRRLQKTSGIVRTEGTRLAHIDRKGGALILFVDGEEIPVDAGAAPGARTLTGSIEVESGIILPLLRRASFAALLTELLNRSAFYFADEAP